MHDASELDGAIARQDVITGPSDRNFGLTFAAIFTIMAAIPLIHGTSPRWWAFIVAALLVVITLAIPSVLSPLNTLWLKFGLLLHHVTNPLVLGVVFFGLMTPIGLLMRIFSQQSMLSGPDPQAASYWVKREPPGPEPRTLHHQF